MDQSERKRTATGLTAAILLFGLLVLYPLSIGPAAWLADKGYIPEDSAAVVYRPLALVCERSQTMTGVAAWYINLWIPPES